MIHIIAALILILMLGGDPCALDPAANWHEVLERAPVQAVIFLGDPFPFMADYHYNGRWYVFVSNDDNEHGRCMVIVPRFRLKLERANELEVP